MRISKTVPSTTHNVFTERCGKERSGLATCVSMAPLERRCDAAGCVVALGNGSSRPVSYDQARFKWKFLSSVFVLCAPPPVTPKYLPTVE